MQEIGHVLWSMNVVPMLSVLQQSDPHQSPHPRWLLVNHLNKKENVFSITTCMVHIRKTLKTDIVNISKKALKQFSWIRAFYEWKYGSTFYTRKNFQSDYMYSDTIEQLVPFIIYNVL